VAKKTQIYTNWQNQRNQDLQQTIGSSRGSLPAEDDDDEEEESLSRVSPTPETI